MAHVVLPFLLTPGEPENVSQLNANLDAITAQIDGNIDETNLTPALATILGVSQAGTVRRGKSIIPATQTRSNAAYGLLPTPDRVSNVVLPTDGLLFVAYQATLQINAAGSAQAAIFIGANQLKTAQFGVAAPSSVEANFAGAISLNKDYSLWSFTGGLSGNQGVTAATDVAYTGDVTTGQLVGAYANAVGAAPHTNNLHGPACIFAAAGTYDVSVQFKSQGGVQITVKNRKLWCWTIGF